MPVNIQNFRKILTELTAQNVTLVAVSKTKPMEDINELYLLGQRDFGENYVQELVDKEAVLPKDINWHFIGHLQSNKVKYIAPFVYLIHGVDSLKLLQEINKQAIKNNRIINCLLQVYIAKEESKFGLDENELELIKQQLPTLNNVRICGLMGMASFTDNSQIVKTEFQYLQQLHQTIKSWSLSNADNPNILSMGMSGDYLLAIDCGSTMVRIGSLLFGERKYLDKKM
jgi:pyridoxal phosphate enzyme (YggS family)